ncbi:MAG: hypothetical protein QOJ29_839 [Thermoleophilaceae bacterium]|nr:hypothetical protein [Thermoleophilaceae bacterium]
MTKTLRAFPALCLIGLVFVAAGCGSTTAGSGTDTAKLAPPSSFVYFEANIDPTGDQETGIRSILADLPGSGPPQQRIDDLIEKAAKSDKTSKIDYLKDVKPWLGDKAAVFAAQPKAGSTSPPWAILVATTDEGKAKDTITKGTESSDRKASYRGTDYVVDKDKTAVGTIDGFFVAGSEPGLKAAVDASQDQSLSESDRYKQAIKGATEDRVGLLYEDLGGLVQAVAGASGQSLGPAAPFIGRLFGGKPVVATIRAEEQALVIDGSFLPASNLFAGLGKSTPLLDDAPGDSWLALGASDFGATLKGLVGLAASALGGEQALNQQLKSATGLDLQQDILSWIGDVAFFVSGDSKDTIGGGALIQTKDPATSKNTLTKLAALAAKSGGLKVSAYNAGGAEGYRLESPSLPRPIIAAQAGDKVAVTYGEEAAKAALGASGSGLTDSPSFKSAADKLGAAYTPSLYVSVPPILRLAESFGAGGASYGKAKPYLTVLDYLIAGGAESGGAAKSRTRIGFKPHE